MSVRSRTRNRLETYGAKPVLWKSMPTESARCSFEMRRLAGRQRPYRARAEPERVRFEFVAVEHRPRPADDGVGVDVRCVVEVVLLDQPVAQVSDRVEIVDAECVRRAHRRHQGHAAPALVERLASCDLQPLDADVILQMGRHFDDIFLAESEPAGDVQTAVVALLRRQDHAAAGDAVVHRVGERLLDAEFRAVEHRAGPAKREHASRLRRIVADQPGHHGGHRRLGQHEAVRRVVRDKVRIVDGGQQRADDARDRRWRDDIYLRPGMAPDRHPLQLADQQAHHLFHATPFLGQLGLLRRRIIERPRPAEQRDLRLQVVELIERPQDGEDEVRIVLPVGDRCRKGVPYPDQQLVVGSLHHATRLTRVYHSISSAPRWSRSRYGTACGRCYAKST